MNEHKKLCHSMYFWKILAIMIINFGYYAGQIGGAVLDSFVEEPLPDDHPLWRRDNVIVVPHFSWSSPHAVDRINELFAVQLARWVSGEPLANVVDATAGY